MNYDFFATESDKIDLLNYIFNETDLKIFDLSSAYGENIFEYKTASDIATKFDLQNGGKFALTFQLWSPRFKADPIFRRVDLDPKYCKGHTFRYATEGLGLIQLYFGGIHNNSISSSHIGHLTQKRALIFEKDNPSMGKANSWDWQEIEKTSRQLKYQIHNNKLAVKKIGLSGILKGAINLKNKDLNLL